MRWDRLRDISTLCQLSRHSTEYYYAENLDNSAPLRQMSQRPNDRILVEIAEFGVDYGQLLHGLFAVQLTDGGFRSGQHPENPPDLLQGQGVQEAHPAQSHPVQGWQGEPRHPTTRRCSRLHELCLHGLLMEFLWWNRLPSSPRVSAVMIESRAVTEVRPSLSSGRRPRPPRRSCCAWSARSARPRHSSL